MVVKSDAATVGEKELKTDWPVEEGLTAGTTKQKTESPSLKPEEDLTTSTDRWGCV